MIVVDTSVFLDELFSAVQFRKTTSISPTANKPSLTECASSGHSTSSSETGEGGGQIRDKRFLNHY